MQKSFQKQADLGKDGVGILLFRMAVPAILAQLVNMLYNVVDRIYIGHLPEIGKTALTGVGVTFPVIMIIAAFSALVGMGGAPRAAIRMGEGNDDEAQEILGNCFVTLLGISAALTVLFLAFQKQMLLTFGASSETLPYAVQYLTIYLCGTVFVQIALGLNMFITSQGFATTSMLTVVIGAVINIILDPILMFGFHMGVRGAAIATVLSQAVSAVWVLAFLFGKKTKLRIQKKYLGVRPHIMLPVLALGVSPFIMQSTESILNISFNASLRNYGGDLAVGAMTIITSLMQMMNLPLMGLTQGAQPIISYNYGAKNAQRVKKAFSLLFFCSMAFTTAFWLLLRVFPQLFVSIFNNDPSLVDITVWGLDIYMAVTFLLGAQIACQQTFIAIGQAKSSLFLALLRKVILLIPLIYILPNFFADKVFAVFLAEPVADSIAVLCTVSLFFYQFRKILRQLEAPPPAQGAEG